jgi:hypothetical protein
MIALAGTVAEGFDYGALSPDLAAELKSAAERITSRQRKAIIEIGSELRDVKDRSAHGQFGQWLKSEFGMSCRTAENYMNAAVFLRDKSETVANLPPTVIYALAASSAPADVVDKVVTDAEAGIPLQPSAIKRELAAATEARKRAAADAKKTPEQLKKEKLQRESKQRRLACLAAERQAEDERRKQEEAERRSRLQCVTDRLRELLPTDLISDLVTAINDWHDRGTFVQLLTVGLPRIGGHR